jgi:tRNA(fMet)-specific endonuclease VapC
MNGRYLLDTNIVIALFAGETAVVDKISQADELFVPSIVLGELFYGAERSGRTKQNQERVHQFAEANTILDCDKETAVWYGRIKNQLAQSGRPIPENDIWIAATAASHNLTLVSRDRHFLEIHDLQVLTW